VTSNRVYKFVIMLLAQCWWGVSDLLDSVPGFTAAIEEIYQVEAEAERHRQRRLDSGEDLERLWEVEE
jgi:hypothetical protein